MAKKTLIIEIGERITKVSATVRKGKAVQSLKGFYFQTPENCLVDGQITAADVLAPTISEQIGSNGLGDTKDVIFVLTSSKIVSREVTLPPVKENRIADIVATNASDYFPIDLTSYQVSHTTLENVTGENPGVRVLVTAAPKSIMTSYSKLIELLGLNLIAFDHVANAQYQVFKNIAIPGITMYLNISSNNALSTFMNGATLMMQRSMPFGGDEVILSAMRTAQFDDSRFSEALSLVSEESWMQQNLTTDAYNNATSRLITGIVRSADFFKSAYKGAQIEKIVLLGSCAEIVSLKDAISSAMSVEVVTIADAPGVSKILDGPKITVFAANMGAMISPLNLIPNEMRQVKSKAAQAEQVSLKIPVLLLIVSVVAGVALSGLSFLDYLAVQGEVTKTKNRIEELSYVTETYNTYVEYLAIENNLKILENDSLNNNAGLRSFLQELELKMPSNLLVLSASCDNGGVSMNIEVETMEDAAIVISQLRTFESIAQLTISPISESETEVGTPLTSFSVSCIYNEKTPELVEVPAPIVDATTTPETTPETQP